MSKKKRVAAPAVRTLSELIAERPIFRFDEAVAALPKTTAESIAVGLNYHVGKKHLVRLRRGLYCRDLDEMLKQLSKQILPSGE